MTEDDWRAAMYARYHSTHYGKLNVESSAPETAALATFAATWDPHLPADREAVCVDLGCGAGQFLGYLASRGFSRVEGVDLSPENVAIARAAGLDVRQGDLFQHLEEMVAKGRHADFLACLDVVEHLTKPELFRFLTLARQATRPGGRLILKTINAASLVGPYGRYMDMTHELAFTEESLGQAAATTGWSRVELAATRSAGWKASLRRGAKRAVYFLLYRVLEGRPTPRSVDIDLVAVLWN